MEKSVVIVDTTPEQTWGQIQSVIVILMGVGYLMSQL